MIGLDSSPDFAAAADARFGDVAQFVRHDVTMLPFPTPNADLIYCRFLLTHLQRPKEAIAKWVAHLSDGGWLLVEELEFIAAQAPGFVAYERFVEVLLASQGQMLFVGSELGSCRPDGTDLISSDVTPVRVLEHDAATLALMNLSQLRTTEWAQVHHSENWFDELARGLELFQRSDGDPAVFGVRQHALRRNAHERASA